MVATLRHLHLPTTGHPAPDTGDPALPSYLRKVLTIKGGQRKDHKGRAVFNVLILFAENML